MNTNTTPGPALYLAVRPLLDVVGAYPPPVRGREVEVGERVGLGLLQRCHAAPWKTSTIAATRPLWASETTSGTPETPRPQICRRKPSHKSWDSVSTADRHSTRRQPPSQPIAFGKTIIDILACRLWSCQMHVRLVLVVMEAAGMAPKAA